MLRTSTDRGSVLLGKSSHGRQGAVARGESVKDSALDTHRLVFPKYAMGTQLGQPDVEDIVALCLTGRKEWGQNDQPTKSRIKTTAYHDEEPLVSALLWMKLGLVYVTMM